MHPTGQHAPLPTSSDVLHPTVKAYLNCTLTGLCMLLKLTGALDGST